MEKEVFQINVREIIRTKAPGLYKKIPGFIIKRLEKTLYQEEINDLLRRHSDCDGVEFLEKVQEDFRIELNIVGEENLPDFSQKCIFASNHPLGGLDGICLSTYLGKKYKGRIRYLVNDILYFIKPLQTIFVPINKHGGQAKGAAQLINDSFSSDNQVITFPAGLCSRKTKGIIEDTKWKKMFITKAIEYQRDIIPVYFEGRNSNLFYNIANLRKKLNLKINIEMLLLPREMFRNRNKTFTIYFGKAIPWQTFDSSRNSQSWADWTKDIVYNIPSKH